MQFNEVLVVKRRSPVCDHTKVLQSIILIIQIINRHCELLLSLKTIYKELSLDAAV